MTGLDLTMKRFWSAAYFIRRGQDRDKSIAVKILQQLAQTATGPVQRRAEEILREADGKQSTNNLR